jgi:hypothetical protein
MSSPTNPPTTAITTQQGETSSAAAPLRPPHFPPTFQIHYHKTTLSTTILHLSSSPSRPLYAASLHLNWYGKSSLTLSSLDGPALATAANERGIGSNSTVKIHSPPLVAAVEERLKVDFHVGSESYSFVVATGTGGGKTYPEKFEWRQSRSQEITAESKMAQGWKLVRLDKEEETVVGPAGEAAESVIAGDGREVVAVLISLMSLKGKVAEFKFLGTGATGRLGEAWEVMAVVTALRIWQMRWYQGTA